VKLLLVTGARLDMDPGWRDLVLFYEFYNPDTGRGHGARYVHSIDVIGLLIKISHWQIFLVVVSCSLLILVLSYFIRACLPQYCFRTVWLKCMICCCNSVCHLSVTLVIFGNSRHSIFSLLQNILTKILMLSDSSGVTYTWGV